MQGCWLSHTQQQERNLLEREEEGECPPKGALGSFQASKLAFPWFFPGALALHPCCEQL